LYKPLPFNCAEYATTTSAHGSAAAHTAVTYNTRAAEIEVRMIFSLAFAASNQRVAR
jgi:hypothetical protein